ncbi:MAG TPA: hypothetical protein VFL56_01510 [Solirubrobacterales bacterium]|nr:hypothetical protein [Solirubrobacterales bacterium]
MNEVALFQSALRAAVPTQPDPLIGAELVPRLAEIARTASSAAGGPEHAVSAAPAPRRSRRLLVARVGIAAATIPLLLAGLAIAGVTVPDAARTAFETVGVELPNQPSDEGSEKGPGTTGEQAPGTSGFPGAPATGELPPKANAKAKARVKAKANDGDKPGRRVRRLGQGPVPGPASLPEGRALGHANQESGGSDSSGGSEASAGKGRSSANAGGSRGNSGSSRGYGKP